MAMYSNFHHSNHPNIRQPYGNRPARRTDGGGMGGGRSFSSGGGSYGDRADRGGGSSGTTLWMGNIDQTLDESAIQYAFSAVGVTVSNVKIIRDKENGLPLGYAFVTFDDRSTAQECLRELNGKKIPNTEDDKRFFLKRANRNNNNNSFGANGGGSGGGGGGGGRGGNDRFSVFVGNLPPEIDNDILHSAFASYYPSTSSARVIMNEGMSKGFGFVSFDDEYDYYNALNQPNMMLGSAPISVSRARNSQGNSRGGGSGGGGPGGRGFDSRDGGDRRPPRRTNYSDNY